MLSKKQAIEHRKALDVGTRPMFIGVLLLLAMVVIDLVVLTDYLFKGWTSVKHPLTLVLGGAWALGYIGFQLISRGKTQAAAAMEIYHQKWGQ
jgi:hypothetical protein